MPVRGSPAPTTRSVITNKPFRISYNRLSVPPNGSRKPRLVLCRGLGRVSTLAKHPAEGDEGGWWETGSETENRENSEQAPKKRRVPVVRLHCPDVLPGCVGRSIDDRESIQPGLGQILLS